jgi:D-psicose/D-tagatose/L-ribulose 3-epimerase
MNPIGANTWIWVSPLTDERLASLAPRIRAWGFDIIELPIENPEDWDPGRAADLLARLGLGATICAVMPETRDLLSDDPAIVASTQAYLQDCVRIAKRVGARTVGGPIYTPVGRTWLMDADARRVAVARLIQALRGPSEDAAENGVVLTIEPLNRYETSFINTVEQAVEVVSAVNSPGCGVQVDTFHMNIEEKDLREAIRCAGKWLGHVQVSGNDRGSPGAGHIPWWDVADGLRDVAYKGPICIESFTSANKTIARSASIWRPFAPTQDELAVAGLAFLRNLLDERRVDEAVTPN